MSESEKTRANDTESREAGISRRRFIGGAGAALAVLPIAAACSSETDSARAQSDGEATSAAGGAAAGASAAGGAGEEENVRVIERYYEAYGAGDLDALRTEFFAADIKWRIPGHHPLSGTKRGADEVLAFFEQLTNAGFRAETITLASGGDWVIDLHRGWSTQGEGRLDIMWALAFRIAEGRIAEAINFAFDQAAADAFFWANFPLKPLPDRLSGS